jgi:hypothetical protein
VGAFSNFVREVVRLTKEERPGITKEDDGVRYREVVAGVSPARPL